MRILIDAQLPPGLKPTLVSLGHEAWHVAELELRDATDLVIWNYAARESMLILTKDEDFAQRRMRTRDGPTVVWLRIGNSSREALARWLIPLLGTIERLAAAGERLIEVR